MSAPERPDPRQGVFETLLVRDGVAHALEAHVARLQHSVGALYALTVPGGLAAQVTDAASALRGSHRLRIDAVPREATIVTEITTSALAAGRDKGVVCAPELVPGGLGAHKWRDRRYLDALGTPDTVVLLVDVNASVLEAAWGNVWLREGDRIVTPPADGRILPGVTRARLIGCAPDLGFAVSEEPISLARAASAELFLTSSLRLVVPAQLAAVAGSTPPCEAGPALERIRAALDSP